MKRIVITLMAAVLLGGASAQTFPDVPANHWAEDAVERIAGLGIVIGFPDGTFRGNEAFTRYQSALVVSRLLDVIEGMLDDLEARLEAQIGDAAADATTQLGTLRDDLGGEIAALRAAMQDLAGDVASQGVRLSAAESAIAGISDEVAATAARVDALEAAMADAAVLRDLQNQIAALRVGVDTAEAQAAAAAERADAAYDLALQALAEADQNRADIAALNRVVQLLGQRLDALGVPTPTVVPEVDMTAIDRLAGDVANIREFVILLRRDQVALRDRVAALEAADAAMTARVDDIEARLETLERTALQITGSISVTYNAIRFGGCVGTGVDCGFDVDRVYGSGWPRQMGDGRSVFTTGAITTGPSAARPAQRRAEFRATPGISTVFSISVTAPQAFAGVGATRMLQEFGAVAEIDFVEVGSPTLQDPDGNTILRPFVLRVRNFMSTFTPIGMGPLTFTFGEEVSVRFTPYVFDIREEAGWVATVGAPDFLAFLNPTLTVAYFDPAGDGTTNRTGIRATMAPSFGDAIVLSGGFSYARSATGTGDLDPATTDQETVWGVDGQLGLLNLISLDFEYATNVDEAASVLYVRGAVDADLPIINMLRGNYRSIAEDWASANQGIFTDPSESDDAFPFEEDQTGFGLEANLSLFIINVGGFFDSYTVAAGDTVAAFGAETGLDLFAGFSITGFYEQVSVNGAPADDNDGLERASRGYTHIDGEYATQFGVRLVHDGAASNALIRGLGLTVEYRRFNVGFTGSDLSIDADYSLNIAIVTLNPYVGYQMVTNPAATTTLGEAFTTIRAGTSLSTTALDFGFVRPSLLAAVNYRSTAYGVAGFTASELQWSVGVALDQFLFGENSTLTARYGSYNGTNVGTFWTDGAHGNPGVGTGWDADRGGAVTQTSGYEVFWNYWDLEFAYGTYTTSDTLLGPDRTAQQFRVRYSVTF